ncbi:unnamed protein product [Spirodela intermedia]|uniref:Uncharacterized protein n=1 Tax=Spirodela intermedia TaxID=51605 RepID=A0A7I8KVC4_SPIIN|nr:unnamed protein product [Spirodela intermedia]
MEGERPRRLLVLYASARGTAGEAAERLGREALRRGCPSVRVLSAQKFDAERILRCCCPEFWKFLVQKNISKRWLEHVHYAVFGLDMKLLLILGFLSLWNALHEMDPTLLPNLDSSSHSLEIPKIEVTFHDINMMTDTQTSLSDLNYIQNLIGNVRSMSPAESHYKKPQYLLRMTKSEAEKVVHHFEFESSLSYQVGDVLEVLPAQDPVAVDAFIRRAKLSPRQLYHGMYPRHTLICFISSTFDLFCFRNNLPSCFSFSFFFFFLVWPLHSAGIINPCFIGDTSKLFMGTVLSWLLV